MSREVCAQARATSRYLSSYSRGYLVRTNIGNAVHTVYVLSLPASPIWLLHQVYTAVSAFRLLLQVWWTPGSQVVRHRRQVRRHRQRPGRGVTDLSNAAA